jgi:hypothetical protein
MEKVFENRSWIPAKYMQVSPDVFMRRYAGKGKEPIRNESQGECG